MVKVRPILYSTPMVKAILKGIKTKTRRTKGLENIPKKAKFLGCRNSSEKGIGFYFSDGTTGKTQGFYPGLNKDLYCPYGQVGDIIYVRETFYAKGYWTESGISKKGKQKYSFMDQTFLDARMPNCGYKFEDDPPIKILKGKSSTKGYYKRPSLFMPKDAARIFLKIRAVTVERLQDISEEDIQKEGVQIPTIKGKVVYVLGKENSALSFIPKEKDERDSLAIWKAHWAELWCKINGRESWNKNPWVWVIEFEKIEAHKINKIKKL